MRGLADAMELESRLSSRSDGASALVHQRVHRCCPLGPQGLVLLERQSGRQSVLPVEVAYQLRRQERGSGDPGLQEDTCREREEPSRELTPVGVARGRPGTANCG